MHLANVMGVRILYRLLSAEYIIAVSALYELLLLNPRRGCCILFGLREWERSRRLTDIWMANTPCWASLGELGWKGCANEEILLSFCGLTPAPSARNPSQAKPPPPPTEKPQPSALPPPPPKPTQPKTAPRTSTSSSNRAAAHRRRTTYSPLER